MKLIFNSKKKKFEKIATLTYEMNYYNDIKDKDTFLYRVVGNIHFDACLTTRDQTVRISINNENDDYKLEQYTNSIMNNQRMGYVISNWKNGMTDPFKGWSRPVDNLIVHNPLYFEQNAIEFFGRNLADCLQKEDGTIIKNSTTLEAFSKVEESLKELQTVIKLQKDNKK